MTQAPDKIGHPSPQRHKVSVPWLLAGLAIPPVAWALALIVAFAISSNACPPASGSQSGSSSEVTLLIVFQLICLLSVIASGLMSRRHWQSVRHEQKDSEHSHLTIGDGRTRFLALTGMLTAGVFAIGILFFIVEPILIPACWSVR